MTLPFVLSMLIRFCNGVCQLLIWIFKYYIFMRIFSTILLHVMLPQKKLNLNFLFQVKNRIRVTGLDVIGDLLAQMNWPDTCESTRVLNRLNVSCADAAFRAPITCHCTWKDINHRREALRRLAENARRIGGYNQQLFRSRLNNALPRVKLSCAKNRIKLVRLQWLTFKQHFLFLQVQCNFLQYK